jgi:hypothetical protein
VKLLQIQVQTSHYLAAKELILIQKQRNWYQLTASHTLEILFFVEDFFLCYKWCFLFVTRFQHLIIYHLLFHSVPYYVIFFSFLHVFLIFSGYLAQVQIQQMKA